MIRDIALPSVSKTADYSVQPYDRGAAFDNSGATAAITLTLPPIADVNDGWEIEVFGVADFKITVTAPSGKLIVFDSAGATSIHTNELEANIGSHIRIRYNTNADKYFAVVSGTAVWQTTSKTASYTVLATDDHKHFDNTGAAGAVTFTLPAIAEVWDGWEIEVGVTAGQNVLITAPTGKLIVFNNAAATTIAFQTASELIGAVVRIRYNGSAAKYQAIVHLGAETQTPTIS